MYSRYVPVGWIFFIIIKFFREVHFFIWIIFYLKRTMLSNSGAIAATIGTFNEALDYECVYDSRRSRPWNHAFFDSARSARSIKISAGAFAILFHNSQKGWLLKATKRNSYAWQQLTVTHTGSSTTLIKQLIIFDEKLHFLMIRNEWETFEWATGNVEQPHISVQTAGGRGFSKKTNGFDNHLVASGKHFPAQ